ncbi:transcription factor TGA2.2 isoform X2 [Arachis ipaensis]|uniref:transcription factor TGA2.2 isoform X2 n=1 Tax=Arachis ipaensis TaxID=130454 RepID=UPI000A2B10CB|nr:transcription factor TGA2.2 isoform X2 [Arachis ipaensis]
MGDNELNLLIDGVLAHPDELFQLKTIGAKADVFHILFGTWKTPAERCFMWLGGFRSSELLKAYVQQLESSRLKLTQLELRLEEKISNSESENQVHRQQALAVSPTRKALTTRLIPEALLLLQQLTHNLIILLTLLFQFM